jgi:hypothetical protein
LESRRDREAENDRKTRYLERRSDLQIAILLQIAEAYERYVSSEDRDNAAINLRALLAAVPLRDLGLVRWQLNVFPDARDESLYRSLGRNPEKLAAKDARPHRHWVLAGDDLGRRVGRGRGRGRMSPHVRTILWE